MERKVACIKFATACALCFLACADSDDSWTDFRRPGEAFVPLLPYIMYAAKLFVCGRGGGFYSFSRSSAGGAAGGAPRAAPCDDAHLIKVAVLRPLKADGCDLDLMVADVDRGSRPRSQDNIQQHGEYVDVLEGLATKVGAALSHRRR